MYSSHFYYNRKFALFTVFVPHMVYGSSNVERLRNPVQARDQTIFSETPGHHGEYGQRSECQG